MRSIIVARKIWNSTGIRVEKGREYDFTAHGRWVDMILRHGANGDPSNVYMRLFERWRRVENQNWFALIGAVNQDIATAFLIGEGGRLRMTASGELTCFANDVRGFYWNNWGSVVLQVTPVV
jgi:hypothetical protein